MPKELERCVKKVKKQGHSESSAYAICCESTGYRKTKHGWSKQGRRLW